ncbi:MAG: phosphoenolpyruvate-utilizing protein [Rhodococcus sp. (in: high G+C Gram-positive bacteria)]|nr:MAG: phosphoenolpyruvate-utilizing protein [Rhodococcus sp. (in: high G+C Gram-positive bacteria)]
MSTLDEPWLADTPPSTRFPIYTRSNISEVFPDVVTPLAATGEVWRGAEHGWRNGLIRFGAFDKDEFDSEHDEMIGIFGGYGYLNVSVSRVMGVRMPGSNPDLVDQSYFGSQPGVPPYDPRPEDVNSALTARMGEIINWAMTADGLPELEEYRTAASDLRRERPDLDTLTNAQLAKHALGIQESLFLPWVSDHFFLIYVASIPVGGLTALTAGLGVPELLPPLISGFGDVDSAAPSLAMWDLGRLARSSDALQTLFGEGVKGLDTRLRQSPDADAVAFVKQFDDFLYEFGSRGVNEWEMNTPTWQTHPDIALGAIDRMRIADENKAPRTNLARMAQDRTNAIETVRNKIAGDEAATAQFEALLHAAEVFLPARERSKTSLVRMIGEVKVPFRELGLRLAEAEHLDHPEDFALVTRQEFDDFVANPGSYTHVIRDRRARMEEMAALVPPFIVVGEPPAPDTWERRDARSAETAADGVVLHGVAACAGVATGPARVINDPSQADELEPGEILVAPGTDPSWTPLFVSSAAVVVDVGAPMSHAAIVSRELGIPCVVSCTDATRRITNGTLITVDGAAGTVTIGQ